MNDLKNYLSVITPMVEGWLRSLIAEEVAKALQADHEKQKPQRMYSREEVCELLHISKPTLWAKTKSGEIRATKIGRRVVYKEEDLKRLL